MMLHWSFRLKEIGDHVFVGVRGLVAPVELGSERVEVLRSPRSLALWISFVADKARIFPGELSIRERPGWLLAAE